MNIKEMINNRKKCEINFKNYLNKKVLKKTDPELYSKHITKAIDNLEFANFLIEEHEKTIKEKLPGKRFYEWCITIYYYSIYHTALALVTIPIIQNIK